jgi:hypothetical protein
MPPPSLRDVVETLNTGLLHARIAMCDREHSAGTQRIRFQMMLMPSGDVDDITLRDDLAPGFTSCAKEALLEMRFAPFDGGDLRPAVLRMEVRFLRRAGVPLRRHGLAVT